MKNKSIFLARILLVLSIIAVFLTSIVPVNHIAIGQILLESYKGFYSAVAFCVFLGLYFVVSKRMTEDIWINRLKFILSCTFLISLSTNIIFM